MIVVKAFVQRSFRGAYPGAVFGLREGGAPAQGHAYVLGLGHHDAKSSVSLRIYLRILLTWLVQSRGPEVFFNCWLVCLSQTGSTRYRGYQQDSHKPVIHLMTSLNHLVVPYLLDMIQLCKPTCNPLTYYFLAVAFDSERAHSVYITPVGCVRSEMKKTKTRQDFSSHWQQTTRV
jgi:hypothetical protein